VESGVENMSIINFTSGINNLEAKKSLSEWAVEFISENKISRGNISHSTAFRNLSRRQKDAIRYQLKKDPKPEKANVIKIPKAAETVSPAKHQAGSKPMEPAKLFELFKIALSLWISGFLLVDIVKIYTAKGMSPALAWQTALLVEVCFFVASICQSKRLRKLAYCFLFYNAFLFGFSEVSQLQGIQQTNAQIEQRIAEKSQVKKALTEHLEDNARFKQKGFEKMSKLLDKGYVSMASSALSRLNSSTSSTENAATSQLKKLSEEIIEQGRLLKNINAQIIISAVYFLLRCVLQLFSIYLLKPNHPAT
jgi:hypothetical protein